MYVRRRIEYRPIIAPLSSHDPGYNVLHWPSISSFRHFMCDLIAWIFNPDLSHKCRDAEEEDTFNSNLSSLRVSVAISLKILSSSSSTSLVLITRASMAAWKVDPKLKS